MFRERDFAYRWAVSKLLRKKLISLKQNDLLGKLNQPIIRPSDVKSFIVDSQVDELKKLILGMSAYVYKFKVKADSIGVGHSKTLDEYTSTDKNPEIIDIEEIKITSKVFDDVFIPVSHQKYSKLKDEWQTTSTERPLFAGLMYDQLDMYNREMYIKCKLYSGALTSKDDIQKSIENYLEYRELFKKFPSIENLADFIQNEIKIIAEKDAYNFIWPKNVLKNKQASSMDTAILIHQYCDCNNIKHHFACIKIEYDSSLETHVSNTQYIICMYKDKKTKKWCIINNVGPDRLSKHIFIGNEKAQDTLELFAKTFVPAYINILQKEIPKIKLNGYTVQKAEDAKYGEFERKYFEKNSTLNRQKIINELFKKDD